MGGGDADFLLLEVGGDYCHTRVHVDQGLDGLVGGDDFGDRVCAAAGVSCGCDQDGELQTYAYRQSSQSHMRIDKQWRRGTHFFRRLVGTAGGDFGVGHLRVL
jgi:hypothetical protein